MDALVLAWLVADFARIGRTVEASMVTAATLTVEPLEKRLNQSSFGRLNLHQSAPKLGGEGRHVSGLIRSSNSVIHLASLSREHSAKAKIASGGAATTYIANPDPLHLTQSATSNSGPVTASTVSNTTSNSEPVTAATTTWQKQFFDSFDYTNAPANLNMAVLGTSGYVWFQTPGDASTPLDKARIQSYAVSEYNAGVRLVAIDIETYRTDIRKWSADDVNASVAKYIQIVQWLKEAEPTLQVGAFGYPFADYYTLSLYQAGVAHQQGVTLQDPTAAWWATAGSATAAQDMQKLQAANNALKPLLSVLDFAAPELYTHIDLSQPGALQNWTLFAQAAIAEAQRVMPGKPVLPYLMPQYTPEISLAWQYIPTQAWNTEVATVWKYADGGIIWGGWNASGRQQWDPHAGWWQTFATGSYKN